MTPPQIRAATDQDALDVIELIGGVFGEYPGCVTDVDGEMPELRRIASYSKEHGGEFWVADRSGRIVGCVGCALVERKPVDSGEPRRGIELKKLYVHRTERGTGLGPLLLELVERRAADEGARFIEFWSDTRFTRAHRFYEKRGYKKGSTRELHDKSNTVEFYFDKDLAP